MRRLAWTVAAVATLFVSLAGAQVQQPVVDTPLVPDEAMRIAVENHPVLQAAEFEVQAAEADRRLARTGYLPRLDLGENVVRSDNPVFVFGSTLLQGRFGMEDFALDALNRPDPFTNFATQLTLQQSVWDAGRTRLRSRIAVSGIDAAKASERRTANEIAFGALQAFWGQVIVEELLEVVRDSEKAAQAHLELATELVDAGVAVPSDRLSAQVRRAEVEAMRIRVEQDVAVARAALLRALGVEDDRAIEVAAPLGAAEAGEGLSGRLEKAMAARPDLRSLEHRIEQAEVGVKLAASHRLPDIGVKGSYEWNGDSLFSADGENWAAGVGLRLSLFDGRETAARVARGRADISRLHALRDALRQGIRLEVRTGWAEFESARGRLDDASTALESSREALRIGRDRYEEGMALIVELLSAEAAYTRARAEVVVVRGGLWLARAGLDLASGKTLWVQASAPCDE